MATRRPSWLPADRWRSLQRYRDKRRKHDATDGFLVACARFHPEYDRLRFNSMSVGKINDAQRRYLCGLLGIPRKVTLDADETGDDR